MRLICITLLLFPFFSFSQTDSVGIEQDTVIKEYFKISGIVMQAETNIKLPFVSFFTGSNLGTISNNDGEIVFKYPKEFIGDTVYLSSIGYKNQEFILPNNDASGLIWVLTLDTVSLKEVIVNPKEAIEIVSTAIEKIPENYDTEPFVVENFFSFNTNAQISLNSKDGSKISNNFLQKQQISFIQRNKPQLSKKEKDEILLNAFKAEASSPNDDFVDYLYTLLITGFESEGDSIEWPDEKGKRIYWKDSSINWKDTIRDGIVKLSKSVQGHSYYSTLEEDFIRNRKKHSLLSKKNLRKYDFDLIDIIQYNNRNTYVISFSRKKRSKDIEKNLTGHIYIDIETDAFVALNSSIQHSEGDKYCNKFKIGKICVRINSAESFVNYKLFEDGKWGLNFVSNKASMEATISLKNLIIRAVLFTAVPRSVRKILPEILILNLSYNAQLVVFDKLDNTSNLSFDTESLILPETTIKENKDTSKEDIWGKYNYIKSPEIPK